MRHARLALPRVEPGRRRWVELGLDVRVHEQAADNALGDRAEPVLLRSKVCVDEVPGIPVRRRRRGGPRRCDARPRITPFEQCVLVFPHFHVMSTECRYEERLDLVALGVVSYRLQSRSKTYVVIKKGQILFS